MSVSKQDSSFEDYLQQIQRSFDDRPHSQWLKSEFENPVWRLYFTSGLNFEIDFRISLSNDTKLTAVENEQLLCTLKHWILTSISHNAYGSIFPTAETAYHNARMTLHLIDFFLLHDSSQQIARYGLGVLTENELVSMVARLAATNHISEAIYDSNNLLQSYLKTKIKTLTATEVRQAIALMPSINSDLHSETTHNLDLTTSEIVLSRCWLFINKLYRGRSSGQYLYAYVLDTQKVNHLLYANTLVGGHKKPSFNSFSLLPILRLTREYPNSKDVAGSLLRTERGFRKHIACLRLLLRLPVSCAAPRSALEDFFNRDSNIIFPTRITGRTPTLPASMVFSSLKNAIEFYLNYGEAVLADVAVYMIAVDSVGANKLNTPMFNVHYPYPSSGIKNVKYWSLLKKHTMSPVVFQSESEKVKAFFNDLRSNLGLHELVLVLYGALIVILGTLMARRQRELMGLLIEGSVDFEREMLIFFNGKSGVNGLREKIGRPLPTIAIKILKSVIDFQSKLRFAGIIPSLGNILDLPDVSASRLLPSCPTNYNVCLDRFCDYFETPLGSDGQRLYIRTHQLRRFFALIFFWGNAAGGMDTLRWFLGHTDIEHLYHYITEVTPGAALISAKASYVASQMRCQPSENLELTALIKEAFGLENISILDEDEAEEYLSSVIEDGLVLVEPIFYSDNGMRTYRIAVKVV